MKKCNTQGCDVKHYGRGFCYRHYKQNCRDVRAIESKKRRKIDEDHLKYAILCGVYLVKTSGSSLNIAAEAASKHTGYSKVGRLKTEIKKEFPDDYFVNVRNERWQAQDLTSTRESS